MNGNPSLRKDLELIPATGDDGHTVILVRDPQELCEEGCVALRAEILGFLQLLDGNRDREQIREELQRQNSGGGKHINIPLELVDSMLSQLDQFYLLDNESYRHASREVIEDFNRLETRPAALAGRAYPENPDELEKFIEQILSLDDGPPFKGDPVAVLAPHIEITAGEKLYAKSYNALRGRHYDRVIVLGVGHSMLDGVFSVGTKNYLTPLGEIAVDRFAAENLRRAANGFLSPNELAHRKEHSIEFQAIFLQHVLEGDFALLPVLVGSLHEPLLGGQVSTPREISNLGNSLDYLRSLIEDESCRTLIVAGMDFSHIGIKFGDRQPAIRIAKEAEKHDMDLLENLSKIDSASFCETSRAVMDRYRVCGFSALSLLLDILPESTACDILGHEFWHEHQTQSAVSYASAVFYK